MRVPTVFLASSLLVASLGSASEDGTGESTFLAAVEGTWHGSGVVHGNQVALTRTWAFDLAGHFASADMTVEMANGGRFRALAYWRPLGDRRFEITWMDELGRTSTMEGLASADGTAITLHHLDEGLGSPPEWRRIVYRLTGDGAYEEVMEHETTSGWEQIAHFTFRRDRVSTSSLPEGGLVVVGVTSSSQAEAAGIEAGDVIVAYDGQRVASTAELSAAKEAASLDAPVVVELVRAGAQLTVTLTAGHMGCQLAPLGEDPSAAYNAGCYLALAGHAEAAMMMLERAVADGYRDREWMENDADLESLHDHPRWGAVGAAAEAALAAYLETVNAELYQLYMEDQADRSQEIGDWSVVAEADRRRRQRVLEMLAAGEVEAADDQFHAAMILQHGDEPAHYEKAHELARRAAELGPSPGVPARWLAAAAKDRHLLSLDRPQIYGTQYRMEDGVVVLAPIDETAVTDQERREWDVPTLAETRASLAARNQAAADDG